ncbi:MAG TPA: hypothetical protein PK812_09130 [Beijerinckiaceae bacterium]|nr:hypothetical protein [Beijerinckiaceae bacterium]
MAFFLYDSLKEKIQLMNQNQKRSMKGTGVYSVPAPDKGASGRRTILVPNLTYDEAYGRSIHCIEATWIPESEMKFEDMSADEKYCGQPCSYSGQCNFSSNCFFCVPFDGCGT